jgi:hypothetical protein
VAAALTAGTRGRALLAVEATGAGEPSVLIYGLASGTPDQDHEVCEAGVAAHG